MYKKTQTKENEMSHLKVNQILEIRENLKANFFKRFPDPKSRERNIWRNMQDFLKYHQGAVAGCEATDVSAQHVLNSLATI